MEKPKPSEVFTSEQLAAIEEMIANRLLSPAQLQQVNELLAKPRPSDFDILAGSSHPALSEKISKLLGKPLCKESITTFSSGEKYVNLLETVRNKIVFIIQTCRDQEVDKDLMELFIMSNTAKHAYSGKRVAVIPYLGYSRQDKIHKKREPITAKLVARLIEKSEIEHVIACHLHADQEQGFFGAPVDHIKPHELFADYFKKKFKGMDPNNLAVISTDAGGDKSARELADLIGIELIGVEDNVATILKKRPSANQSKVTQVAGDVKGKTCIIYDDMIDTAGSVCNAKEALLTKGANPDVYLCATHAIFSGSAIKRLKKAKFRKVVVTDTLPLGAEKQFKGLKQLSVAPLIADKMAKIIGMPLPSDHKTEKMK